MERLSAGVTGIDRMLNGGFPRGYLILLIGEYGTGKTIFSLQYLWKGLELGEPGVYITLDQDEEEIIATAGDFGWELEPYINEEMLAVIRLNPADIKVSIERVESELPDLIRRFKTKRLVFDSITLFETLFSDEAERRERIYTLAGLFKGSGLTTVMTSEGLGGMSLQSRYGFAEYLADGVISLRYIRQCEMREVSLALEIVKMRRTAHSRKIMPYSITDKGIVVHTGAELF
ncbi:MAG TPA: KaiC domain-containing protein [Candidatus Syntrophoarchaeum butanivorans]|uniref:Circadian clock protein KaiC n=1 Tax=Candidatus Syntropharchaeum butanivorans TaxID=1839936 RepID=A0A1F2P6E0_9EURY|nr:MAG: circadian clock protein KaiC [Candidatus Syntrophoarchaeum butanivorans]HEC57584.1 KaiC domain-containing protein [Candidatus Syntrophoarchaeum butanivorans]